MIKENVFVPLDSSGIQRLDLAFVQTSRNLSITVVFARNPWDWLEPPTDLASVQIASHSSMDPANVFHNSSRERIAPALNVQRMSTSLTESVSAMMDWSETLLHNCVSVHLIRSD